MNITFYYQGVPGDDWAGIAKNITANETSGCNIWFGSREANFNSLLAQELAAFPDKLLIVAADGLGRNTYANGVLRRYPNTWSIVNPADTDLKYLVEGAASVGATTVALIVPPIVRDLSY